MSSKKNAENKLRLPQAITLFSEIYVLSNLSFTFSVFLSWRAVLLYFQRARRDR